MKAINEFLIQKRKETGLSQNDIANQAGITPVYLWQIENDKWEPSDKVLKKLAGVYRINPTALFLLRYREDIKGNDNLLKFDSLVDNLMLPVVDKKDKKRKTKGKKNLSKLA